MASICIMQRESKTASSPANTINGQPRRCFRSFSFSSHFRTCRRNASSTSGGQSGATPNLGFSPLTASMSFFKFSMRISISSLMRVTLQTAGQLFAQKTMGIASSRDSMSRNTWNLFGFFRDFLLPQDLNLQMDSSEVHEKSHGIGRSLQVTATERYGLE